VTLQENANTKNIKPCKEDNILSCTVAKVDLKAFDDEVLSVPGCKDMKEKNVIQDSITRSGASDGAKSVAYVNEKGCEAIFSARGDKVYGNVNTPVGDFALEPCSAFKGCHVWKEEDTSKFVDGEGEEPPEHSTSRADHQVNKELREQGIQDNTTIVTFTVKYYFTKEAKEIIDDIDLYFDQITAITNEGFINSLIPVRMKIHCIELAADLEELYNGVPMLKAFDAYKGSYEALRGGADAAALIVKSSRLCGIAWVDGWRFGGTLTVQTKQCAQNSFILGHELGHNFGCWHDRDQGGEGPYSYGFGAFIADGPYRTIMSYHKTGYEVRANIYSSTVAKFENTIISGTATEDNARVIKENRFGMAAVGNEEGTCDWYLATTTSSPPVTTTSGVLEQQECKQKNVSYVGETKQWGKRKTKNAKKCENKCAKKKECVGWTYFPVPTSVHPDKNSKKTCWTFTKVNDVIPVSDELDGTQSGTPSLC